MKNKKTAAVEDAIVQVTSAKPLSKPAPKKTPATTAGKEIKVVEEKVIKAPKVAKAVKEPKAPKVVKEAKAPKKPQVVRDSFTMPENEYLKIAEIKATGLKAGLQVKKSEVLRAGLKALCAMDEKQLKAALGGLDKIKTGRPNKH